MSRQAGRVASFSPTGNTWEVTVHLGVPIKLPGIRNGGNISRGIVHLELWSTARLGLLEYILVYSSNRGAQYHGGEFERKIRERQFSTDNLIV